MWKDVKETHRAAGMLVRALPIVVGAAVAIEGAQHLVEWQLGMYSGLEAAAAVEAHPLRMGFGYAKTGILFLVCYFAWRHLAWGDEARTLRVDPRAMALFAPVLMFNLLMVLAQNAGGDLLSGVLEGRALFLAGFAAMLGAMAFELLFAPWKVASAVGNARVDLGASLRIMSGQVGRSFLFNLAVLVPAMVLHYALGIGAMFAPAAVSAALLALDTLFVGYMAMLLPAIDFAVAKRATDEAQVSLAEDDRTTDYAHVLLRKQEPSRAGR